MDRLRQLAPWQIILSAIGSLVLVLVGGYFLVTMLTTTEVPSAAQATVPGELDKRANEDILKKLEVFEKPDSQPAEPEPVRTVDPNAPSTVNPFR